MSENVKELQERIAKLEQAIRDMNEGLGRSEHVDILRYMSSDSLSYDIVMDLLYPEDEKGAA